PLQLRILTRLVVVGASSWLVRVAGQDPAQACLRSARLFFFSSRRRHTRCYRDWSSDVCSSDLTEGEFPMADDRDDVEREHTTVVETGGGGGGGVLAVVLLIIVVLVLLYVFRADLGLGSKSIVPSTVNV